MTKKGSEEFDPLAMIENSIQSGFDPTLVQEIDERDLAWCPNIATWILDGGYLDLKTIYPHQLQVMLKLFGDVCPYCSDWEFYLKDFPITDSIDNILDRLQLTNFGLCPKCHKTRIDQYNDKFWIQPNELDLLWGMRSGKSAVAGIVGSYALHRFLKLPDPARYYNLIKGSLLVMRFVALTAQQAAESIWMQFVNQVENCAWFGQYHDFLKYYEQKKGVELQRWLAQSFGYTHKKILGYYQGASIDTSRGRTAIFSAFDEIGWWTGKEAAKRANASETYTAYEKASRTIRNAAGRLLTEGQYDAPTAIIAAVSSTSSKADYMMELIRQSKTDPLKVASHKASWEVNPEFTYNPQALEIERRKNHKVFDRDYGSVPPYSQSPFFENVTLVNKFSCLPLPNHKIQTKTGDVGVYLDATLIEKDTSQTPYLLALDLGKSFNGFAGALMRLKETDFSVIQVAGLFSLYPNEEHVIDLGNTFDFFTKVLCERFNIRLVVYDQWQSKTQIDQLKNQKIDADTRSPTYQDFELYRAQLQQGKIEYPEPEIKLEEVDKLPQSLQSILYNRPYLHFIWQTLSISEVGRKITKGEGQDDLFRAVILGALYLWDDEYKKRFEYRAGQYFGLPGKSTGRMAIAGGSRGSGQSYTNALTGGSGAGVGGAGVVTSPRDKRPLGVVVPRGRG